MEVQHAFWTEKRNANFGFLSTFSVSLRFETVVNESGALCYRISVAFAEDPTALFTTLLAAVDCTKYVKEVNEFSQKLHELVLDSNSIMDLVTLSDETRLILSVRATAEPPPSELRWFSVIVTRASAVEQSAHVKTLLTHSQNELLAAKNENSRLAAENLALQQQVRTLEEASVLIRRTVDKLGRLFSSASSSAPAHAEHDEDDDEEEEEEDGNLLPDSLADKSGTPASRHSHSASPMDLRAESTAAANQELLLGIASYLLCAVCEKVSVPLKDSSELSRHFINEHVDEMKRRCLACSDANVFDLVSHIKTHTHRVYACEFCGKKGRKHFLKSHVRTHTGEKPYKCPTCGRRFADQSTIRRHQTTVHTNEKKFMCPICGRDISRKDNYRVHLKSHSALMAAVPAPQNVVSTTEEEKRDGGDATAAAKPAGEPPKEAAEAMAVDEARASTSGLREGEKKNDDVVVIN